MISRAKGFTLLEVLVAVVILGAAIMTVAYMLQQSTLFSKANDNVDRSVQITRTVMEEIKQNLKTKNSILVYGQLINLKGFRESTPPYPAEPVVIQYPNANNPLFNLMISSLVIDDPVFTVDSKSVDISQYFRKIKILTVHLSDNKTYELESYAEYN